MLGPVDITSCTSLKHAYTLKNTTPRNIFMASSKAFACMHPVNKTAPVCCSINAKLVKTAICTHIQAEISQSSLEQHVKRGKTGEMVMFQRKRDTGRETVRESHTLVSFGRCAAYSCIIVLACFASFSVFMLSISLRATDFFNSGKRCMGHGILGLVRLSQRSVRDSAFAVLVFKGSSIATHKVRLCISMCQDLTCRLPISSERALHAGNA